MIGFDLLRATNKEHVAEDLLLIIIIINSNSISVIIITKKITPFYYCIVPM